MPSLSRYALLLLTLPPLTVQAQKRTLITDKGTTITRSLPHPLSWWTHDPLRLDESHDLMIGTGKTDVSSYQVRLKQSLLGSIEGHKIVQLIFSIDPLPDAPGQLSPDSQWKILLIQGPSPDRFREIYQVQADSAVYLPFNEAYIYGKAGHRVLTTNDGLRGNGAQCTDAFWWFDRRGAHPVSFGPLYKAIEAAIPPGSEFQHNCWALQPRANKLKSSAKVPNTCHACGYLGTIHATYTIRHGQAIPKAVHYQPTQP